ncbi:MAG: Ig-like domain-containing protein [Flavobacteriaceae bacterium]
MSKNVFFTLCIALVVWSCAKRGHITGGEVDIYPPKILKTTPENFSTNFNAKEIVIVFDEYVKLKDVNKQLIVSPPLKYRPEITPYTASKQIKIRLRDTLQPNTTYSFNFGQSIEDNNESNKLRGFKYVFSTGSYIDSLSLSGFVKDALEKETESYVSVLLYEVNEQFNDSIVYKENPRYVTTTMDSTTSFTLENLKEGNYLLVALKDQNNNFRFDPQHDKIGFHNEIISVPTEENFKLELFKEVLDFKPIRAFEAANNKIILAYEGNAEKAQIELRNGNEKLETRITPLPERDSLQIWYRPLETDSLHLMVRNDTLEKSFTVKLKEKKTDTLVVSPKFPRTLGFRDKAAIEFSTPLENFDSSKMKIYKDSVEIKWEATYVNNKQSFEEFIFEREEKQKYTFLMLPEAVTDFFGQTNDTLKVDFSTKNYSDFGNLKVVLQNVKEFPVIVQLTDNKGKVVAEQYSEEENTAEFMLLNPAVYTLRVIYDSNKNQIWDTGNYLKKIQPEKVVYYPEPIDVRANWDIEQTFILRE